MKHACLYSALLLLVILGRADAQETAERVSTESTGTPAAQTFFQQAEAALSDSSDYAKAKELYLKAIEIDPRYAAAHDRFIFVTWQEANAEARRLDQSVNDANRQARKKLNAFYAVRFAKHPNNAIYAWALGETENYIDWEAAERHYLKAIEIDPAFARGYDKLALVASLRGDSQKQIEYLKKASELDPRDGGHFLDYALALHPIDPARSIDLLQEVASRYPNSEWGAKGLYWAAFETRNSVQKIAIFERLRREFPPTKFSWSDAGTEGLFAAYQHSAPKQALALAEEFAAGMASPTRKEMWQEVAAIQRKCIEAHKLIAAGQPNDALALLGRTERSALGDAAAIDLIKAEALDAGGDARSAYESLTRIAAKAPTDAMHEAITRYGHKLGKDAVAISADLKELRQANAKLAPLFALPDCEDRTLRKLEDYRGKVVLVNFWYPSCGPCRGEFPSLQRVLRKHGKRGFEIIAINTQPEEDALVVPYMRNNRFTFRALSSTDDWARKTYSVKGYPRNFLIDTEGRIIFELSSIRSAEEERTFELQVESLLPP